MVGAGDNFLAGYVFGMYNYQSEYNCVNFGQLCSELTLKSDKNVAPEINDKTLLIPQTKPSSSAFVKVNIKI